MPQLTASEATVIVAAISLVGGGLAFLLRRWWTDAARRERAAHLNSVADLAAKLREKGMTLNEVRQFEAIMNNPAVASSEAAKGVVTAVADDAKEPSAFQSNVALKARTGAAYEVAKAQLEQALMDLRLLLSDHEYEALEAAQERWREYRRALEDFALREYEGGTHATLALLLSGLSETERRTKEIRAKIVERSAR